MGGESAKPFAALAGVCLCLLALLAWRLPTDGSPPGLDLRLIAIPPGELTVEPVGVLASAQALQAGEEPIGDELSLRNIAGRRLLVRPVALASNRELANVVRVRIAAGNEILAEGTPASLRDDGERAIALSARAARRIEVEAWLPPGATEYRGRILDLTVEFHADRSGARQ